MRIIYGISDGMVMQRDGDACLTYFSAEHKGGVKSTLGKVEYLGENRFALTGIPVGGPYEFEISDGESRVQIRDAYVGDVWILAGQSNMEGAGLRREREIEYDNHPDERIRAFYLSDRWEPARSLLHQQWLNTDAGVRAKYFADNKRHLELYGGFATERTSGVGPGHFIGLRMFELTGVPQGLIPCAYGGSNLLDWSPENETSASLYRSMIRRLRDAGGRARGVFWHQGEGETNPEAIARYNDNMRALLGALRRDAQDENLPFVQAQIGHSNLPQVSNPEASENWQKFKDLQRLLPSLIPNTATVSTANSYLQDLIHIDAASHQALGYTMAEEMNRLITGRGVPLPELNSIKISPHPTKRAYSVIELTYANVVGRLVSQGRPYGFSLTLEGEKPYEYPYRYIDTLWLEGDRIMISVEDAYLPISRAYLWYAAGFSSVCTIEDEAGRTLHAFGPIKLLA